MSETLEIPVEQRHIDEGDCTFTACPIAHAAHDMGIPEPAVFPGHISVPGDGFYNTTLGDFDEDTKAWIEDHDDGEPVEPTTAVVELVDDPPIDVDELLEDGDAA